ncbi:hypothetical protein TNCV_2662911 [Trichonephila clavipes]|nr:hypothetical protein TNCV_2662911 [Trichonephila clavipes]
MHLQLLEVYGSNVIMEEMARKWIQQFNDRRANFHDENIVEHIDEKLLFEQNAKVMRNNISFIIYLYNARAGFLDHLTPSLQVPTDGVVSREFIQSSALEQVVPIHPGMVAEWVGLVSYQVKTVKT